MMTFVCKPVDIPDVLASDSVHSCVKDVWEDWNRKDPVDNIKNAELLLRMFVSRYEAMLERPIEKNTH